MAPIRGEHEIACPPYQDGGRLAVASELGGQCAERLDLRKTLSASTVAGDGVVRFVDDEHVMPVGVPGEMAWSRAWAGVNRQGGDQTRRPRSYRYGKFGMAAAVAQPLVGGPGLRQVMMTLGEPDSVPAAKGTRS